MAGSSTYGKSLGTPSGYFSPMLSQMFRQGQAVDPATLQQIASGFPFGQPQWMQPASIPGVDMPMPNAMPQGGGTGGPVGSVPDGGATGGPVGSGPGGGSGGVPGDTGGPVGELGWRTQVHPAGQGPFADLRNRFTDDQGLSKLWEKGGMFKRLLGAARADRGATTGPASMPGLQGYY